VLANLDRSFGLDCSVCWHSIGNYSFGCSLKGIATFAAKILPITAEAFDGSIKDIPDLLSSPKTSR